MLQSTSLRAAIFAVAASTLYATAFGQSWPTEWDTGTGQTADDQGQAVAVDHLGNVFVAGKTKEVRGSSYDMVVIKYDSSGTRQWVNTFHSKDSMGTDCVGDSVATGIAVDWHGDCVVCGLSSDSTSSAHYKLTCIKYDAGGSIVWPTSGSRTGYVFDRGAIRLSDTDTDGINTSDSSYLCSIAMENVAGSQPNFAVTCPTSVSGMISSKSWKVAQFEYDATDGVKITSGWPVSSPTGSSGHFDPYGIAINPSDHTVYVTGQTQTSSEDTAYTTVRYNSDGTQMWRDDWSDGDSKDTTGKSIALDGDVAWVTGYVRPDAHGRKVGTRKISTVSGSASVDWSAEYQYASDNFSEGNSISLGFEVEEDGSFNTYGYVTGYAGIAAGQQDMMTLRYDSSGSQSWVELQGASGQTAVGNHITVAGNGNAYVVGTSNNDYILAVYDRTGSTRFTPVTFDGGSTDDARFGAIGGAGLVYFTGVSFNSTHNNDVHTEQHAETLTSYNPGSFTISSGSLFSGSLSDLDTDNGAYVTVSSSSGSATVVFGSTIDPTLGATELSFVVDSYAGTGSTIDPITEAIWVYDYHASAWVEVAEQAAPTSDTKKTIVLKDNVRRFSDGSGNVSVKVTYSSASGNSYKVNFDMIRWDTINL